MLSLKAREELLQIARTAIGEHLQGRKFTPAPQNTELQVPGKVFVTLRRGAELRGCIGSLDSTILLAEAVCSTAVSAATSDPRFPPLQLEEISRISLEISLLSSLTRITSPEEIE